MGKYDLDYSSWQQLTIAMLENIPEGIVDEKIIIKDLTGYPQKQTKKMAMDDFRSLKQKLKKTAMIPAAAVKNQLLPMRSRCLHQLSSKTSPKLWANAPMRSSPN